MKHQKDLFGGEAAPWEEDDAQLHCIASIVFSEAPYGPLDYSVPEQTVSAVTVGQRIRVPLGRGSRTITGYCTALEHRASSRRLKDIIEIIDASSLLSPALLRLTKWMSEYYMCEWGRVLEGVLPAAVRGQAGTREVTLLSVSNRVGARLSQLKLPAKQAHALQTLFAASEPMTPLELAEAANCSLGPITELRRKELVQEEVKRIQSAVVRETPLPREVGHDLNSEQASALQAIVSALQQRKHVTALLHGVTGSGKTEVYIQAIEEVVRSGRQAIVLVPEISLTPQTRQRFRSRFDHVAVLHSHLSDSERHWHWKQIAGGQVQVVIGARSAIFAPTPNLGLIVLDEEHDTSFKQDTAPRYHARDVARFRAVEEAIPLILGSATPSLESYWHAQRKDYQLLDLPSRVEDRPLPVVSTIDLRSQKFDKSQRGSVSRALALSVRQALVEGGQVILMLNRRGFSTHIQCPACGHVVNCPNCDISLTDHKDIERAICHYCEYQCNSPRRCPDCGFDGIRFGGLGTQKLEAEVRKKFPEYQTLRMDSDTMRKPGSHETALASFRAGDVDILLGTQMIAKGLDFPNVTLVGVINADTALHLPDFRAGERTFQLVTQVAGRTGRGGKGGRVVVQTFSPEHPSIQAATRHDYDAFVASELPTREQFGYPPASALALDYLSWANGIEHRAIGRRTWHCDSKKWNNRYESWAPLRRPWQSYVGIIAFICWFSQTTIRRCETCLTLARLN